MFERTAVGALPPKHHVKATQGDRLLWEECLTREGFEGPYTIAYHREAPHRQLQAGAADGWPRPIAADDDTLAKRHFLTGKLPSQGAPRSARVPLLFNDDLTIGVVTPTEADDCYFINGDADDLLYIQEGAGTLRSALGDLAFTQGDYVFVPRGTLHRFTLDARPQAWLWIECRGGLSLPQQWRNAVGQLRMDAPYCHRDFVKVSFVGPIDEGLRRLVVKRHDRFHAFELSSTPLDVVGWDGTVYPWAFPISRFQPRVGLTHLPPTWHGTFAARGALICSFVPRPVDFHPDAVPCPYPHASVDIDEVIFYSAGNFTSRRGVGPQSLSFHPAGIPHGPHPGAYEASLGTQRTDELAVMLDCARPLRWTPAAQAIEDATYHQSFVPR